MTPGANLSIRGLRDLGGGAVPPTMLGNPPTISSGASKRTSPAVTAFAAANTFSGRAGIQFAWTSLRSKVGNTSARSVRAGKIVTLSAASIQIHHQPPTRSCDREIGGAWSAFPSSSEYANSAGIPPVWRRPRSSREQSRRPRHRGQARPSPLRRARPARWSRYSVITASRLTSSPVAAPQVCSSGLLPSG
jgi:hypothetical protein